MIHKTVVVFLCARQGLAELGLIKYIGDVMVELIKMVPSNHQMLVALVLVVWVSALASSFIDNIPFTTATVRALCLFILVYLFTFLFICCCCCCV